MQIECKDNLEFMQQLQSESIDLIYCDILFGTGKKFKDYQDLKADRKVIEDFYFPRIKEMHRVLKSTGTIYLQMDLRIVHWVRLLMDDAFGYKNFLNQIVVTYNIGGVGKREFAKKHDYIIVYSKTENFTFNDKPIRIPYKSVVNEKLLGKDYEQKLIDGVIPTNVWNDIPSGLAVKKESDYFSEKHEKILFRIIQASSNDGDTVADFFLGSGTTAIVCKELNRNFIGYDINERAIKITNERLNAKLF